MIKHEVLISSFDGLALGVTIVIPDDGNYKGIVQISHGMSEHRLRYLDFMEFLGKHGYIAIIHDHRGHGDSVLCEEDYGYFYRDGADGIVEDLYQINCYIREKYELPVYLFGHSMGTLVARLYLKKYDDTIAKLILCGPPYHNLFASMGKILVTIMAFFRGWHYRSIWIDSLVFHSFYHKFPSEGRLAWINSTSTLEYESDSRCGFLFTLNGFYTLFTLVERCFSRNGWEKKHMGLPIFIISGSDDPVIGNKKQFQKTVQFLEKMGYSVLEKLYVGKRHEILNEDIRADVYLDVLNFIEK